MPDYRQYESDLVGVPEQSDDGRRENRGGGLSGTPFLKKKTILRTPGPPEGASRTCTEMRGRELPQYSERLF